jgi:hypothetical protein
MNQTGQDLAGDPLPVQHQRERQPADTAAGDDDGLCHGITPGWACSGRKAIDPWPGNARYVRPSGGRPPPARGCRGVE